MNHDDEKQLRLLAKLHYAAAVLAAVIPLLGALYGALGVAILLGKLPGSAPAPGKAFGWLPLAVGLLVLSIGLTAVVLNLACARCLRERRNHLLCLLASAMNCMHFPFGSLLGTFTLIVLCRPAVAAAFQRPDSGEAPRPSQSGGSHYFTSKSGSG